jgi:hypothetical protein
MLRPTVTFVQTLLFSVALQASAAVLPLVDDGLSSGSGGGLRGALLAEAMLGNIAGQWSGKTSAGRVVTLVLQVKLGTVSGNVMLAGVLPDATGMPLPLKRATLSGRTIIFSVQGKECDKATAHGSLTFVSGGSAQLDLQAGATPIRVTLSKVG